MKSWHRKNKKEYGRTHSTQDTLLRPRVERLVARDGRDVRARRARVELFGGGALVGLDGVEVRQYAYQPAGGDGVELGWISGLVEGRRGDAGRTL